MRRVVTALIIVMVASALTACGGAPADTGTTGTPAAGTPAVVPAVTPAAAVEAPAADIYSPTQTVKPGEMFPTDTAVVPASVLIALGTKRPLLVFWYDPTATATERERTSIDAMMDKYAGTIDVIELNYTLGLAGGTLDAETQKLELLAAALGVKTTPYILFVDANGRITYRFAGWVDSELLGREVIRATQ